MPRQIIWTPHAPRSALFSQGVRAGSHIYFSGTTGTDPATGALAESSIGVQTRQVTAVNG